MSVKLIDTRTQVETPENVLLTFELAGPGSRMGAYLLDLSIRSAIVFALGFLLLFLIPWLGAMPIGGILVLAFLAEWGYFALFEGLWRGQTPGKYYYRLRVIKEGGYPITLYDAALRNFLRAADFLPIGYGVGLMSMSATKRLQRIGDVVAGTMVIRDEKHRYRRNTAAFDKLEPIPPAACSGRYQVSERTLDVAEQLLWRKSQLSKRRMEEIASILAKPIASRLGYPLEREQGPARDLLFLRRVLRTFAHRDEGA